KVRRSSTASLTGSSLVRRVELADFVAPMELDTGPLATDSVLPRPAGALTFSSLAVAVPGRVEPGDTRLRFSSRLAAMPSFSFACRRGQVLLSPEDYTSIVSSLKVNAS